MRRIYLLFLLILLCHKQEDRLKVVVTTSLIQGIVEEIGKDKVEVSTLIPSGMCPGHFDIKPQDMKALSSASLVLSQGWERIPKTQKIGIEGNWMIPDIHIKAVEKITEILCRKDPENREGYRRNGEDYKKRVLALTHEIKKEAKRLKGIKVVSSQYQKDFLEWLGLDVVGVYARPEDLTPKTLKEIIDRAKREGVRLVVDNLQSGKDAGLPIAEEIGAKHITLTNFPENSYIESLRENVEKLLCAIRQ